MYEQVKNYNYEKYPIERRFVPLMNGDLQLGSDPSLVAHCTSLTHPGFMTAQDMAKHNCYARNCPYLHKLYKNPFWQKWQPMFGKQLQRDNQKAMARAFAKDPNRSVQISEKKAARIAATQKERCATIRKVTQEWLQRNGFTEDQFIVVDVAPYGRSTHTFRINYVSDQPRNDLDRFSRLERYVINQTTYNIRLIHVVDKNDYYATVKEYRSRKKW